MQGPLLERVVLLVGQLERLVDAMMEPEPETSS